MHLSDCDERVKNLCENTEKKQKISLRTQEEKEKMHRSTTYQVFQSISELVC